MRGDRVAVVVDLSPDLAWALAQFVKRVGWSEIRSNAVDGEEAEQVRAALEYLRDALAVAGFSDDDLSITLEDRQLVIRGRQAEPDGERVFLHRGIAARAFQRSFVLADGVEVVHAGLENGLLNIDLSRSVPNCIVQTIPISRK